MKKHRVSLGLRAISCILALLLAGCSVSVQVAVVNLPSNPAATASVSTGHDCKICDALRAAYPWLANLAYAIVGELVEEFGAAAVAALALSFHWGLWAGRCA